VARAARCAFLFADGPTNLAENNKKFPGFTIYVVTEPTANLSTAQAHA
jgi:hypothetical protein